MGLYGTDATADIPRPTIDVDISVQVSTYAEMEELQQRLAKKGFFPASDQSVLYRYNFEDVLVDFIPYEDTPLGPTNPWLKPGFEQAVGVDLGQVTVHILPAHLFLLTKWVAHKSRGGDPRASQDFEDIVYVLDYNQDLKKDVFGSVNTVREAIQSMCAEILSHPFRQEIIECHVSPFAGIERVHNILSTLEQIMAGK